MVSIVEGVDFEGSDQRMMAQRSKTMEHLRVNILKQGTSLRLKRGVVKIILSHLWQCDKLGLEMGSRKKCPEWKF
jgi:hypothetical protein